MDEEIIDISGNPDALPEGDAFILVSWDGTGALQLPREDVLYAARTQPTCFVKRCPKYDPPF